MGAWPYVKPRLDTAMRELFGQQARRAFCRCLREPDLLWSSYHETTT